MAEPPPFLPGNWELTAASEKQSSFPHKYPLTPHAPPPPSFSGYTTPPVAPFSNHNPPPNPQPIWQQAQAVPHFPFYFPQHMPPQPAPLAAQIPFNAPSNPARSSPTTAGAESSSSFNLPFNHSASQPVTSFHHIDSGVNQNSISIATTNSHYQIGELSE
jgi:hypothetical protein